jgi:hypothetical protein
MRYLPPILCVLGILAMIYGYWGLSTVAGRRRYDEMAGIIPFSIGAVGALAILGGVIWLVVRMRS